MASEDVPETPLGRPDLEALFSEYDLELYELYKDIRDELRLVGKRENLLNNLLVRFGGLENLLHKNPKLGIAVAYEYRDIGSQQGEEEKYRHIQLAILPYEVEKSAHEPLALAAILEECENLVVFLGQNAPEESSYWEAICNWVLLECNEKLMRYKEAEVFAE